MTDTKTPSTLSAEAAGWWKRLITEYSIEDEAGLLILQTALEALDRMRAAQRAIKKEGMQVADRFNVMKPHGLLPVERDSRAQLMMALKALNLDIEPLRDGPGRPGGR